MKLSRSQCDKFKPKTKAYKKFDGGGLYLEVTPKGKKLWRLKYYYQNKEKRISFGSYPLITLVSARKKRDEAKLLLEQGVDPSRQRKRDAFNSNDTFKIVALEWHAKQQGRWGTRRSETVIARLEKNIFPFLGDIELSRIESLDLLAVLQKIESRGALEVAKRVRQICGQVFRYGIITGRCTHDPTQLLHGALASRKAKHYSALQPKEIPEFLDALGRNDARLFAQTRNAIMFSMLTFCRPGEIRHAEWENIDMKNAEWVIPAEKMKSGRDHIVPLAKQVLAILEKQTNEEHTSESPWVFPAQRNHMKPMSEGTVNVAIKRLGFAGRMTAHGFRALARTTIREKLKYYPDVIEAQLAHKPPGPLGRAYDRAQFLDERKQMMQDWADFVEKY